MAARFLFKNVLHLCVAEYVGWFTRIHFPVRKQIIQFDATQKKFMFCFLLCASAVDTIFTSHICRVFLHHDAMQRMQTIIYIQFRDEVYIPHQGYSYTKSNEYADT